MLPRKKYLFILIGVVLAVISSCDVAVMYGPYPGEETMSDPDLLAVTNPSGGEFTTGETIGIAWEGSEQPDSVTIELHLAGSLETQIARNVRNEGGYRWTIPDDVTRSSEVNDEYRIVVSGYHPDQRTGSLLLVATSASFTILPAATGGLSDVTVDRHLIDITLTDNGQEIDGDTVDVYLNGTSIALGHVLSAAPGTTFGLALEPGDNVLEIYAVNEGSVSPNTALLEISDVVEGLTAQEWRLAAGDSGFLTITAP